MGEVRSAQQKCVRRALLEPLILLNFEHLLSTPDLSRAALSRMQVIAAEDIGVGALGLVPALMKLEAGWTKLGQHERARRLIRASHLCVNVEASRFLPCWLITLIKGVEPVRADGAWLSLDALLERLHQAIRRKDLMLAGITVEEIFLRHPMGGEDALPDPIGFSRASMARVWDVMRAHCPVEKTRHFEAWCKRFGPPSKESIAGRLFLYLALVALILDVHVNTPAAPEVSDDEVQRWLRRAQDEVFEFPDWVFDRHTPRGKKLGLGYQHFFEEAVWLANPSDILGRDFELDARETAMTLYFEEERHHGARASTSNIRKRWRQHVLDHIKVTSQTHIRSR